MRVHISNINGFGESTVALAQRNTLKIGQTMGYSEVGLFHYNSDEDSDSELDIRIDGILSSIWDGDIFVLQLPTWNNLRYENCLVDKIKTKCRLIIFLHDVIPEMFEYNRQFYDQYIDLYNKADVLIVPSEHMLHVLKEQGLTVEKTVIQEMWDIPMEDMLTHHGFARRFFFTGNPDRFQFINSYKGRTPIELYDGMKYSPSGNNVAYIGYRNNFQLISEMSRGGFGLIWADDYQYNYYKINAPYKFSTYIAAGIPVISRRGVNISSIIASQHLGFVVDTLEEADELVQSITDDEYWELLGKIQKIQFLVTNGAYTRKVLNEAVINLLKE